jgi:hypothetical protein
VGRGPQVDAVEQRTGKPPAVALDLVRQASAVAFRVAPEAAGARVHRGDENEPRGIRRGAPGARNRDRAFLERLAERIENVARELSDLIEEQGPAVREADLAGPGR